MASFDFKKIRTHLLIIAGFALLSLIFCYPALQGKELFQADSVSWKAAAREALAYKDSTGIGPLWTNSMFGGMPLYTIAMPGSHNYIYYLQAPVMSILIKPAYFLFLAMLGFYVLMLVMRVNKWLGVAGAIAYAFATYNISLIATGHETKMIAIAYLPAVFAGLILLYRGKWLAGAALLGISMALFTASAHWQIVYYALILIFFYAFAKLIITIRNKESIKNYFVASIIALVVAIIGLGPSMPALLPTREYTATTMRGGQSELTIGHDKNKKSGGLDKDYAFMWSHGQGEVLTMLVPYLYGGASNEPIKHAPETEALVGGQADTIPLYWGPQPIIMSGAIYFGAIICFLFVLGMLVIKSPHKWWILIVSLLAVLMSMGDHFKALNYFLFDHLPMYNKFRTPTMTMVIPQMLFPLLGIWGLAEIINGKISKEEAWKKLRIATIITGGFCLLLAFAGSAFFDFKGASDERMQQELVRALVEDRKALATKSALISAFYILLAAALIWAFIKDKIKRDFLIGGIGLLIAVDLISVANNYLNESSYKDAEEYDAAFQPRPVDAQILQDKDPYYRVLDLSSDPYNDAMPSYFHKAIGGYSPAKMEIYQDLIDVHLGGKESRGRFNAEVLAMLNTKYIIFRANNQEVAQRLDANGNAWFVEEVKWAKTADEEMLFMNANALGDTAQMPHPFDSKKTAIIRNTFEKELERYSFGKDSTASIKLTKYGLDDLYFESQNSKDGLAVFSDIWYPYGWEAYVDGKPVNIIRANYVLRAIKIPAGHHKIEFHFRPKSFKTGNNIALISSIILFGLLIGAVVQAYKKDDKDTNAEEISM